MLRSAGLGIVLCLAPIAGVDGMPMRPVPAPAAVAAMPVLYANRGTLWANVGRGRVDIDVCWVNPENAPGATAADRAIWRDVRRRAVEEWSRHARINFHGWDGADPVNRPTVCVRRAPGLHIVICNLPKDPRCPALPNSQSEPGGYPKNNGLDNGVRLNPQHDAGVAVHEFGHTLGLYHEEERPDAPQIATGPCKKQSWPNNQPLRYGGYDMTGIMSYCKSASAAPWLSPNDIAAIERLYGRRKSHSLVTPRARCVASHDAAGGHAPAVMSECGEGADEELTAVAGSPGSDGWRFRLGPAQAPRPGCLAAAAPSANAAVESGECGPAAEWRFQDVHIRGFGGLCLDLLAGRRVAGTAIQIWQCGALGGVNQRWTRARTGQIRYADSNFCAQIGPAGQLQLAACDPADDAQRFTFVNGAIRRAGNCLEARGPSDAEFVSGTGLPANGGPVREAACNASLTQEWNLSGAIRYDAAPSLCLARRAEVKGSALYLANCSSHALQVWDHHF